jgi:hypothetical protein
VSEKGKDKRPILAKLKEKVERMKEHAENELACNREEYGHASDWKESENWYDGRIRGYSKVISMIEKEVEDGN